MSNSENLQPFTSENQPPGHRKSRKGIPNRATIFKKWLKVKVDGEKPDGESQTMTAEDAVVLSVIEEARNGNVKAQALVLDSLYGKITDKTELTGKDGTDLFATFQIATRPKDE